MSLGCFVYHALVPRLTVDLSGEFSLYDHVLDHSAAFNVIPKRYVGQGLTPLDVYFAMGRGRQANGVDVPASEMKKWYVHRCLRGICVDIPAFKV